MNIKELIYNLIFGIRYSSVTLNKRNYDLGVCVIEFLPDGKCRAAKLEFINDYDNEDQLLDLALCFNLPFLAYGSKGYLQHPLGWEWTVHKKRLTFNKAYSDFKKIKTRHKLINTKFRTLKALDI